MPSVHMHMAAIEQTLFSLYNNVVKMEVGPFTASWQTWWAVCIGFTPILFLAARQPAPMPMPT